jgi:hypothetical protein
VDDPRISGSIPVDFYRIRMRETNGSSRCFKVREEVLLDPVPVEIKGRGGSLILNNEAWESPSCIRSGNKIRSV